MKRSLTWLLTLLGVSLAAQPTVIKLPEPQPRPGQKSVLELRCPPIRNVRVAFVGAGSRGFGAIRRFAHFPKNTTIVAVSDLYQKNIDKVSDFLKRIKYTAEVTYSTDPNGWKKFCERGDVDLIYCTTPPELHAPIAVYAMKHGKHVVVEVPFANKLEEYWEIVDTAEQTQRHWSRKPARTMKSILWSSRIPIILSLSLNSALGTTMDSTPRFAARTRA